MNLEPEARNPRALLVGIAIIATQVVVQFLGRDPSELLVVVGLLIAFPELAKILLGKGDK